MKMDIKLDQHFMEDKEILKKIVDSAQVKSSDTVFEIGCGPGFLTKVILDGDIKKLISCDIDESFGDIISSIKIKHFEFILGNALEVIDNIKFDKIISNIPYSITEPLYEKILDRKVELVVMLHGIDFYKNIIQRETKWKYYINAFYNVELIDEISGDKFEPKTKVKSVIVKLTLKNKLNEEDKLIQELFNRRNRSVKNALIYTLVELGKSKREAKEKIGNIDIKLENKKLKNLSNIEFYSIISLIKL